MHNVVAENTDFTWGQWRAPRTRRQLAASSDAALLRRLVHGTARFLQSREDNGDRPPASRLMPDAFAFPPDSMAILIWEVCCYQDLREIERKWVDIGVMLDPIDAWHALPITVDTRGIASCTYQDRFYHWVVGAPFPMDLRANWTERAKAGGLEAALSLRLRRERVALMNRHDRARAGIAPPDVWAEA
jgi:hypothetical protein